MGKPGFVPDSANGEDSEATAARAPYWEIGMRCGKSYPHAQHTWQMSGTGWCGCDGRESTPIYDRLIELEHVRGIISDLR